ncbi:Ig-like domain-containing protein [Fluviicola sp.]|uniref:Calx-beta domain-containing protein n=1 Tax=Fluviicola sp. TaxID=1917219 RepID=UPI0031D7C31F
MKTNFSNPKRKRNLLKLSLDNSFLRIFTLFFTVVFLSGNALADGTRQASPTNSADGASLLIAPDLSYGSYMGCANDNRIRFTILNAATENLYFGFQTRNYNTTASTTLNTAYYRIYNAAGTQVAGPTLIPTSGAGFISTYAQAFAGPNIGGATPAGYNPMMFDPATTGDFYIEIYRSDDGGTTMDASGNGRITMPFFDFTVSTAGNTQSIGRIWSRKWSFVTTNLTSGNFEQSIASSFTGDYYAYTPDNFIVQVQFQNGFRPLAYEVAMNFNGAANTGNFVNDRRSSSSIATLTNGYRVFLSTPDAAAFPPGTTGNPAFTSSIYGCPGSYFIPYYIDQAGDVGIVLDLNGTAGYQAGTADIELTAFGMTAGNHVMSWNGLNGLGAAVPANFSASVQITLYQGRTNLPMNDAEMNINGLTIISVSPSSGSKKLYWDDTNITPVGACASTADNNNNVTTGGVQGVVLANGILGPTHAWNGSNPTTAVPAPASGGGNGTALLCDDYGNARCINTWFYAVDLSSPVVTMVLPNCDKDNDGIADNVDLDDDNDGVADLVENGGLPDATADADSDGVPNYIDPDAAGFADTNFDGVDDRYDFDKDGVINSFDLDSDNDGIPDLIENGQPDANSNAQIDGFVDLNGNGLSDPVDPACNNTLTFALAGAGTTGTVTNAAGAFDNSLTTLATLGATGAIDIDLGALIPSGTVITVNLSSATNGTAATGSVFYSTDDVTYTLINTYSNNVLSANGTAITYTLPAVARYIRVTRATNSPRLHAIRYPVCAGVTGTAITPVNTDGTGGANYLDIDSDNDGITDNSEAQSTTGYIAPTGMDTDRDGLDNAYDTNNGGTAISPVNTDGTDNPDYTDADSDNDGISDAIEGWDTDGDGTANTAASGLDSDNDGLDNAYDTNNSTVNPTNGTTPNSYPNVIISGTPERDWREVNPPKVTLSGSAIVTENSGTVVTLTATLSAPTGVPTVITLTYSGTATNGTDYTASSATITIPAGSTTGTVTVTPINDGIYEGTETAIATITSVSGGNGATIGSPASATVTITDDETVPTVSISGGTTIVENSGGSVTLTVTLSAPTTAATVVNLGYTGTATSGTDYTAGVASVTIPANATTATLTITPLNDAIYEGNETVITTITSVSGGNGATIGSPTSATVTITDDETVPAVSISGGTTIGENSGGSMTLTVTLSTPTTAATVVNLGYTGTATSGTDYMAGVASVTIPANATTATFTISPVNDGVYEGNETIITTITSVSGGNGATIGSPASTTTTIVDDETVPTVSISGGTTIGENSGSSVTLTITLSGPASTATVVNLGYTGTATSGADYSAGVASVTIPANATTATLTISPINDAIYEGNETVITTITSVTGGNGATIGSPASATVTITDDETVPTVSISGGITIAENNPGTVTLTVTLSSATTTATVVNLGYTGTATAGTDYVTGVTSVTIPANATTATLVIDPNDDAVYEGNETVITTITSVSGGNGATIGSPASTTTTITDNETVPTVSISGGTTIGENSGSSVIVTITLSGPSSTATVVNLGYTGTATSGADYTAGVASVTIPANATTATLTITPLNDAIYEGNETVITTITSVTGGNGATIGSPASTTTTIVDDETVPTVSISGGTTIGENSGSSVIITVTLSSATTVATVVNLGYTGTATSGADYTAGVTSVTIPANATTATLTITPVNDGIYEGNETVITTITSVTGGNGASIGSPASTTVTIVDDETVPTVSISGGTTIAENSPGTVTLTVTLSVPTTVATVVNLGYTGTATSGTDYVAGVASVTIPANATTATLVIDPNDDLIYEGNETVITTITSVSGGNSATIGSPASTTTTIVDNETVPTVTLSGTTTISENSGTIVTLTATLSSPTTVATVITLTNTGTATSGTDYTASAVTITIPANSTTGTITITTINDGVYEGTETVITTITSITGGNGATIGSPASTTVTITDDEAVPTVSISGGTTIAENSSGTVTLTVTLSGPASTATVVNLGYTGTATSGTDYLAGVTSVTIPANATTATLVIDPNDDLVYEGNETVIATITSVTGGNGATIGSPASTTTTIVDNETVPTVSISGGTTIAENSPGTVTLTVTLSGAASTATVVNLGYTGTATSGTDYVTGVTSVTIPANATTATLVIDPNDDVIFEGNETVITTITSVSGGNGATIGSPASTTTTIVDDETVPTVSISGGASILENNPGTVTLTVTLSVATTTATTINLGYTGTATSGTDYVAGVTSVTIPAGSTTATFVVDPNDDLIYEGDETVVVTITSISGGNGATIGSPASTTVIIVDNDNAIPVANDNGATTNEDVVVIIPAIQGNDTDSDGTVVTATIDLDPSTPGQQTTFTNASGTWTVNTTTGDVTFTPAANFNGTATITYTINDNLGATSNTANLTVVVAPVNDAPVVDNETHTINEDSPATGDLTNAGDSDPDGTALTANTTPVVGPSNGTIAINANGTYTYTPNANFNGTDMVVVSICDAGLPLPSSCVNDTIFITVIPVNDTPVIDNETVTINEDTPATGDLTDAGDFDPDGTTLTANPTPVSGPSNGTIVINANGTYTYTPNANFNGTDMVVVSICDAGLPLPAVCVNDTIFITVIAVNDAPVVDNEMHTINEDTPATGDLTDAGDSDPDGTALTANTAPVSGPSNGTILINANGTYTYTPNANFNGTDMVVVSICDAGLPLPSSCVNDTIFITVTPVNDTPVIDNETVTINEDTPATGDLTDAGDFDPDGTTLTANPTPVSGPSNGTIVINSNGTYTYTPNANFSGTDMVVVSICDAGLPLPAVCVNDTIFITVTAVNDSPVVDNEMHTINEDTPATGDLTDAGDSDPDGTALTVNTTPVVGPSNGTIVINANGTYTYTPNANFNGTDMVVVSICDAGLPLPSSCVNDTIFITVTPVNDTPVIDNETVTINEDTPATGDLTGAGDFDPDGTTLTANSTPVSGPLNGTIVINSNGTYTYTPNANFNGADMVVVSICDAGLPLPSSCVNDTIFITITPINDVPVIDNEYMSSINGNPVSGDLTGAGDFDTDGNLVVNTTPASGPNNGTIIINTDGTFTYTPDNGFSGTDTIVVSICDDGNPLPVNCVNDTIFVTMISCPSPVDSDNDGLTDCEETTGVNDPSTPSTPNGTSDPNNPCSPIGLVTTDTDNDGLTDCEETTGVDDPSTPGVPNGTSNPNDACDPNPLVDSDGDGLTNCEETTGVDNPLTPAVPNGTSDPNNPCSPIGLVTTDTDNDGLTDCEETTGVDDPSTPGVPNGTSNPNDACDPNPLVDSDGDGLTNCEETTGVDNPLTPAVPNGTSDPNNACSPIGLVTTDTDNDGLTDCEETTGVNDPNTPATPNGTSDPNDACSPIGLVSTDTDGDGLTDCEETTGVDDPSTPGIPNGTSSPTDPCSPKPCGIDIPEAFTPDGDGTNDVFVIEGIEKFPDNTITIFNRWGYEVFSAESYDNTWGGNSTSNLNVGGDQLPTGTYYYIFDTGTTEYGVLKGYIYLKR